MYPMVGRSAEGLPFDPPLARHRNSGHRRHRHRCRATGRIRVCGSVRGGLRRGECRRARCGRTRFEAARRSSRRDRLSAARSRAHEGPFRRSRRTGRCVCGCRPDGRAPAEAAFTLKSAEDRATTPFTVTAPAGARLDRSKLALKRSSMEPDTRDVRRSHIPIQTHRLYWRALPRR